MKVYLNITYLRNVFLPLFALIMSGCQLAPQKKPTSYQQVIAAQSWEVTGKLSYRDNKESFSANLSWSKDHDKHSLRLSNLFGATYLLVEGDKKNGYTLEADGNSYHDAALQPLLDRVLGWSFPVSQLEFWLKGQPASASQQLEYDKHGKPKRIVFAPDEREDWQVTYKRPTLFNGVELPGMITVKKPPHRIKLAVTNWYIK